MTIDDVHPEDCAYCQAGEGMRHLYEPGDRTDETCGDRYDGTRVCDMNRGHDGEHLDTRLFSR